jgi:predicted MFS family arabinose efflux permease
MMMMMMMMLIFLREMSETLAVCRFFVCDDCLLMMMTSALMILAIRLHRKERETAAQRERSHTATSFAMNAINVYMRLSKHPYYVKHFSDVIYHFAAHA